MLRKITKLISLMLVLIILCSNTGTIISYAADAYERTTELEEQGTSTNNENVEFDAYFADGKHSNTIDLTVGETKLYLSVKVKNAGYLENATINLSDCNFNIADDGSNEGKLQSIDVEKNIITLNKIAAGNSIEIVLNITPKRDDIINPENFSKDSIVEMEGTYINSNTKTVEVSKNITINTSWHGENPELNLTQEVVKYIPYEIDGDTGLLVQTKINLGIKNNLLPIKSTNLVIEVPIVAGEEPERVIAYVNKTAATNGKTTSEWINYNYGEGILAISNITNPQDENGNVVWTKNDTDEYIVTYIYSSSVYEAVKDQSAVIRIKTTATCEFYNDETIVFQKSVENTNSFSNKIGQIVTSKTNIKEDSIAKGYMYGNKIAAEEDRNETIYNVEYTLEVAYSNLVDKLTIETASDKFITDAETLENYAYNKRITVNKAEFDRILGTEGNISILSNGTQIVSINKNSEIDSQGNLVVNISSYNTNSITIETSKPTAEGRLTINVQKAISTDLEYTKNQIAEFKNVKSDAVTKVTTAEEVIETIESNDGMSLTEPTSNATISINKTNLSTVVTNEDVEIKAVLEAYSMEHLLYTDPEIYIHLPEAVTGINIKSAKPLYDDELSLETPVVVDIDGHKAIKIVFEGTQTKYNDISSKGVSVVIYADIDLNKTAASGQSDITMTYTNKNDTTSNNSVNLAVNIVSPKELITINTISEYADGATNITAITEETKTANLVVYSDAKTATVTGEIINNYENTLSEVSILGRIPNTASTNYDSNESVGNTFDTTLNGAITLTGLESGYTIYYSTNASATKNLTDSNNSWTTSVTDYSEVKSYLIVIDEELVTRADILWTYKLNIPANINYKNSVNSNYKVYMKNNAESGIVQENKVSPIIKLQTEAGPELEVKISSIDVEEAGTTTKGKRISFDVEVNNTGSVTMNNVLVEVPVPAGMIYNDYWTDFSVNETTGNVETVIREIASGEKETVTFKFDAEEVSETEIVAQISAEEFDGYIRTNIYKFNITDAEIALVNTRFFESNVIAQGDVAKFEISINNLIDTAIKDVVVEYQLPEGLEYTGFEKFGEFDAEANYDANKNIVTVEIEELPANTNYNVNINAKINEVTDNMQTIAKTTVNGKEYTSNIVTLKVIRNDYSLTAVNNGTEKVESGEQFTSQFIVENTGEGILYDTKLTYTIPDGATFISASIEYMETEYNILQSRESGNVIEYIVTNLYPGEKAILSINLKVDLEDNQQSKEIESYIDASNEKVGNKKSSVLTYIVAREEVVDGNIINNEIDNNNTIVDPGHNEPVGYEIYGKVWIDRDKNGTYDTQEETLSGLTVLLINKEDGRVSLTTITNDRGMYTFDNLKDGEYMIAFLYDTSIYSVTEYQKEGVSTSYNSDAINSVIEHNGVNTRVGLTDTLTISGSDLDNVDLGIYRVEEFDLSLQKYISRITVNNDSGVKTYDYANENKTLTKVEIPDKYISESTVIIEYKIVVKNEGDVPGYAKKIVDYLSNDLKFSSELNPQAYLGNDGNIYSEELAQTLINPGESKEITLILIKNLTGENTGTVVNSAEIAEAYNDIGLEDVNSIAGNKDEKENDLGFANVIITVKTGQVIIYSTLTITTIAILAVGIYLIKKYVINI